MYGSIFGYVILAFCLGLFYYHFKEYPSLVYNISCLLNILWITLVLYKLKPVDQVRITSQHMFWVLSALLVFYAGIFFLTAPIITCLKEAPTLH